MLGGKVSAPGAGAGFKISIIGESRSFVFNYSFYVNKIIALAPDVC